MAAKVPFNDVSHRLAGNRPAIEAAFNSVLDSGHLVLGEHVLELEREFASFIGTKDCVGVANGTDALELAFRATGVDSRSIVATAANAGGYAATALASIGATPLFVDVDEATHTVTLETVHQAISSGANAVVVTHLYGQLAPDIEAMATSCNDSGVALIEDCAQAHGARRNGRVAGSFGSASAFSFYPTKNLGALGDGGAVCGGLEICDRVRSLRQYGWTDKYTIGIAGGRNSRLDEMQAAFLLAALPTLNSDNAERIEIALRYTTSITSPHVRLPSIVAGEHVGHLFVVQSKHRDELRTHLQRNGVTTNVHYPIPDHQQPLHGAQAMPALPVTERLATQVLSLPCYPGMSKSMVDQVIDAANSFSPSTEQQ